eukprot:IDg20896t1
MELSEMERKGLNGQLEVLKGRKEERSVFAAIANPYGKKEKS